MIYIYIYALKRLNAKKTLNKLRVSIKKEKIIRINDKNKPLSVQLGVGLS